MGIPRSLRNASRSSCTLASIEIIAPVFFTPGILAMLIAGPKRGPPAAAQNMSAIFTKGGGLGSTSWKTRASVLAKAMCTMASAT